MTPSDIRSAFLERIDAQADAIGPDWQDLRAEIVSLGTEAFATCGEGGSLSALLFVESGGYDSERRVPQVRQIYQPWAYQRAAAKARKEKAAMLATTVEVRDFRGGKFAKPRRIPKEEAEKPWKPGCVIVSEESRVTGRGFDSNFGARFSIRSTELGGERDEGTIVAKRLCGAQTQYLMKPRSAKAEQAYRVAKRLAEIDYQLGPNGDFLTTEQREALVRERNSLTR